jgi:hypothetical protein
MIILKYLEYLITNPKDAIWVYDRCDELPKWDEAKQDYVFKRPPKRIDPREAKELIKEHGLKCVHKTKEGEKVYAEY